MAGARGTARRDSIHSLGVEIFAGRAKFRLSLLLRRLRLFSGHDEVRQVEIERYTCKSLIEGCFGNTFCLGFGPKIICKPILKLRLDFRF